MPVDDPTTSRRPIPGFARYHASEDGTIWSYRHSHRYRHQPWITLKAQTQGGGYLRVSLREGGTTHVLYVHRLILLTFVGPCPEGMESCHNDGDRTNNRLSNLRYDTRSGNHADKKIHGTFLMGSRVRNAKLTEQGVAEARLRYREGGITIAQLAARYHVSNTVMQFALNKRTWKHVI